MKNHKRIYIFLMVLFSVNGLTSSAQTNNSPYSIFGIGDIDNNYYDRSSGMGNSGIGLSSGKYIYQANPASVSQLDFRFFSVEMGGSYKYVNYSGNPIPTSSPSSQQFQITRFTLAVKPKPFWGISFGLMPYSSSNYTFYSTTNVRQSNVATIPAYYEGTGGLNQVYLTNGLKLNNHFSIGLRTSFIFGSLQQNETLYPSANSIPTPENPIAINNQINRLNLLAFRKFNFQGGVQYKTDLTKKWALSLGAIASTRTNFSPQHRITISEGNPANGLPTNLVNDSLMSNTKFSIPVAYGGGLALSYDKQITFSADYKRQNWADVRNSNNGSYTFNNSERWSGGLEYAIPKTTPFQGQVLSYEKYFFQVGGFHSKDYLSIRGNQLTTSGVTLGVGINGNPLRSNLSYMFNFQFGTQGTTSNNLIKQNYMQVGVVISYRDFWRPRIQLD